MDYNLGVIYYYCCNYSPFGSLLHPLIIFININTNTGTAAAAAAAKSLQLCLTLYDPKGGSPPGSLYLGFSRHEHWSGLPFPSPMHESEK